MEHYNNKKNLFYKLKKNSIKDWKKYTEHYFVKSLGDGSLSSSVFKEYLIQDYIFLQRFIKILALSAYKAKSIEDMNRSVDFIIAIKNELKLHVHYCKKFGILKNKIFKAKERKENKAYTNYVMKIGLKKSNLELFIALSPCVIGYGEIGYNLKKNKNWKKSKYSSWIKMYSSKEYQSVAKDNIEYLDRLYKINKKKNIKPLIKIFKKASKLEANFWQMAYNNCYNKK